jgi:uncharacterized protein
LPRQRLAPVVEADRRDAEIHFESKLYVASGKSKYMPDLGGGLLGCYRCAYVWRFRRSPVRICPRCKSKLWNTPRKGKRPRRGAVSGLGVPDVIGPHRAALRSLADKYGVSGLQVFGSVAKGMAGPKSDVDFLIRVRRPMGLLRKEEFRERLESLLGRKVELTSEQTLHWYIRPQVLEDAVPV